MLNCDKPSGPPVGVFVKIHPVFQHSKIPIPEPITSVGFSAAGLSGTFFTGTLVQTRILTVHRQGVAVIQPDR